MHVSPELGARFKVYTVEIGLGGTGEMTLLDIQRFAYVLKGAVALVGGTRHTLGAQYYAYLPANTPHRFEAASKAQVVVFEKPSQALAGLEVPSLVHGHEPDIPSSPLLGGEALQVRLLLPDSFSFDMAVSTMTFVPGGHLPFVETHERWSTACSSSRAAGCTGWPNTGIQCRQEMRSGWPPTARSGLGHWAKHPASA